MTFLIQNLSSRSELEELNKVFIELDTNGNGTLSKEELYAGYKRIFGDAFSPEEVDDLFKKADTDESGQIDYSEWATVTYSHWNLASGLKLEEAFAMFDRDGNQKVSAAEIRDVFKVLDHMDPRQMEQLLKDEMDDQGELTLPQFKTLMSKLLM